ncbi:MAG: aspartate-semialdehyde dehydrogenase, partial [Chlamydiae bacterium]|nr:aspartate-semialdehyde dehydrogenase [Chlamydiota bacterium]
RSVGKTISFRNETIALELLDKKINEVDLAFFCAGSKISKEWIPKTKCLVVDSSSAFRDQFPLVIPEINEDALKQNPRVVSSPNCAATILLMPLFPLHKLYAIKRIIVSTYQAASGGGAHLLNELQKETQAQIENRPYAHALPFPYAFNLFPHNSALDASGYVEEEIKIKNEVRKILDDFSIQVSATCVRVPVFRAHSLSANVEFHHRVSLSATYEAWHKMPGLKVFEDRTTNRFATPCDVTGKDEIFVGRLRIDTTQPNTLEFWAVGDQLRKGAALNAVQLGEALFKAKTGFTG